MFSDVIPLELLCNAYKRSVTTTICNIILVTTGTSHGYGTFVTTVYVCDQCKMCNQLQKLCHRQLILYLALCGHWTTLCNM